MCFSEKSSTADLAQKYGGVLIIFVQSHGCLCCVDVIGRASYYFLRIFLMHIIAEPSNTRNLSGTDLAVQNPAFASQLVQFLQTVTPNLTPAPEDKVILQGGLARHSSFSLTVGAPTKLKLRLNLYHLLARTPIRKSFYTSTSF
jgi:hypothetical protein